MFVAAQLAHPAWAAAPAPPGLVLTGGGRDSSFSRQATPAPRRLLPARGPTQLRAPSSSSEQPQQQPQPRAGSLTASPAPAAGVTKQPKDNADAGAAAPIRADRGCRMTYQCTSSSPFAAPEVQACTCHRRGGRSKCRVHCAAASATTEPSAAQPASWQRLKAGVSAMFKGLALAHARPAPVPGSAGFFFA